MSELYYKPVLGKEVPLTGTSLGRGGWVGGSFTHWVCIYTGEAAGRQMWHWEEKAGKQLAGKEGAKTYTFSAAVNPNR